MSLIMQLVAPSFAGGASRAAVMAGAGAFGAPLLPAKYPPLNALLAVDSLWSIGGRAIGPAIRTPAGGPGRSRMAP